MARLLYGLSLEAKMSLFPSGLDRRQKETPFLCKHHKNACAANVLHEQCSPSHSPFDVDYTSNQRRYLVWNLTHIFDVESTLTSNRCCVPAGILPLQQCWLTLDSRQSINNYYQKTRSRQINIRCRKMKWNQILMHLRVVSTNYGFNAITNSMEIHFRNERRHIKIAIALKP